MVSSISEIYSFNTSGDLRKVSIAFAIIVLIFFVIVVVFLFIFAFSSYKENEGEHNKFSELIRGLKPNRKERLYVAILMARRLIFIMILIFSYSLSSQNVIGLLIVLQCFSSSQFANGEKEEILQVQPIYHIEENQPSIENMAEIQNTGVSQRITEKKEEEKIEKQENDLKLQNLDDSLNIDGIFPHKK